MANKKRAEDEEEELTKLLESFSKEQLIYIIRSVSIENTKIIEEIYKRADQNLSHGKKSAPKACELASSGQQQMNVQKNSAQRKIFIGNVSSSSEITAEKLHKFFSKFGEIERGPLGFDKDTGKPRGYALFIYKTAEGARKALEKPIKNYNGHVLHCAIATGGSSSNRQKISSSPTENQTPKNDGCDSAAMAPRATQPRVAVSGMENSQDRQPNTSHQIGPSGKGPATKPGVCVACVCYYLKQFMLFSLCLVGVLFIFCRVF